MPDSARRAPLSVFVPSRKLLDHELKCSPDPFSTHFIKKGSYPAHVLVRWDVSVEGVRLTVDPWAWSLSRRVIRLVEWARLEDAWEAERDQAVQFAMEEARCKAWNEFPSFKRWKLLRDLESTPR